MDNSIYAAEVRELAKAMIVGIEACLVSNEMMGFVPVGNHPLKYFLDEGLLVSAGTDDPLFFGVASVREMLVNNGADLGLTPQDALRLARNGIATVFVTEKRRAELRRKLEEKSKSG